MKYRIKIKKDLRGTETYEPQCKEGLLGKWGSHPNRSSITYYKENEALKEIGLWKSIGNPDTVKYKYIK